VDVQSGVAVPANMGLQGADQLEQRRYHLDREAAGLIFGISSPYPDHPDHGSPR
jgi:hypothetical protein